MPGEIVLQLSHKDVFLGFFKELKREVLSLKGGDTLFYKDYTLYNQAQKPVARLSQNMQKKLAEWRERGYEVKSASVRFVVETEGCAERGSGNGSVAARPGVVPVVYFDYLC